MKYLNKFSSFKRNYFEKLNIILFGISLLLGASNTAKGQVSAYTFSQSSGTFTPITGTVLGTATDNTTALSLHSDVYALTLPFGFDFNDVSYNEVNVFANGFITFGTTPPPGTTSTPISGTVAYNGAISAFGRDINSVFNIAGVTGNIAWDVVGTAPNREIVIQWKDFRPAFTTQSTNAYTFSFQIRLKETTNDIKVVYSSGSYLIGNTSYSAAAEVGLRGYSNIDFNNRLNAPALEYTNSTAGTANNSGQSFSTTAAIPGMPAAGLTYMWTPPSCYSPTGVIQTSAGTTINTASVSWNAVSSAPGNGYEIYYSTSSTAPASSTTPQLQNITATSAVISSLSPSTTYYIWLRSKCGAGNASAWSLRPLVVVTKCQPPALVSTAGATVCPNQSATLSAATVSGSVLKWYDEATAGSVLATSPTYTTPSLAVTTNYWVSAVTNGSDQYVGKTTPTSTTGNGSFADYGIIFDAHNPMTIKEVDVYPMHASNTTGTVTVKLKNSAGTILATQVSNVNVSPAGVANTITLNFDVPSAGTDYRLVIDGVTGISNLRREGSSTGFAFPYNLDGICTLTASRYTNSANSTFYYYFYNWKVAGRCESPRAMVTATVDAACLGTSETDKKNSIKVYPNPFSDVINIDRPELVKSIQITELSGKLIKNNLKAESVVRINDLIAGIYILQLDMKDGSKQTVKIIKK